MRFFAAFSLLFCSAMFAQEPPVAKEPSSKDKDKEVLKALISELDSEEIDSKLKVVHKKECEKILKDNCFSCHSVSSVTKDLGLFDEENEVLLKENKDTLVKFIQNEKSFDKCKKLEEKQKTRLMKFFGK
jgi:hypothetical protein